MTKIIACRDETVGPEGLELDPKEETPEWVQFEVDPVPYPRYRRGDWSRSKKFFAYRDAILSHHREVRQAVEWDAVYVCFVMRMPRSWSGVQQERMHKQPHRQTPDLDNLVKGLFDCIYHGHPSRDDKAVHRLMASKVWGRVGSVYISPLGF